MGKTAGAALLRRGREALEADVAVGRQPLMVDLRGIELDNAAGQKVQLKRKGKKTKYLRLRTSRRGTKTSDSLSLSQ